MYLFQNKGQIKITSGFSSRPFSHLITDPAAGIFLSFSLAELLIYAGSVSGSAFSSPVFGKGLPVQKKPHAHGCCREQTIMNSSSFSSAVMNPAFLYIFTA